jgi:hypothetical protein
MAPRRSLSVEACSKVYVKSSYRNRQYGGAVARHLAAAGERKGGACGRANRDRYGAAEEGVSAANSRKPSHIQYSYLIAIRINAEYPSFNYKFYSAFYFSGINSSH